MTAEIEKFIRAVIGSLTFQGQHSVDDGYIYFYYFRGEDQGFEVAYKTKQAGGFCTEAIKGMNGDDIEYHAAEFAGDLNRYVKQNGPSLKKRL